jgi:hypothetical protein
VVQFGSMLAVPILLAVFPPRYSGAGRMWGTVILYATAKIVELLDREMASVGTTTAGSTHADAIRRATDANGRITYRTAVSL